VASHAVSGSYFRSEHMSPAALAAAVLLHAAVAAALWWLSAHRPVMPPVDDTPVEVTIEQPKPPEPPPEPPKPKQPEVKQEQPVPPVEGLRPPAELEAEKPTQVPTPETNRQLPPNPPQTAAVPEPKASPPPAPPKPEPPRPEPPKQEPQKQAPAPQATHGIAVPPANPMGRPAPSPLSRPQPSQRSAATAPGADQPAPSPFVNPADARAHARAQDNYLWQVVSRLRGYTYHANVTVQQAVTVVRIVIARDGRLLSAEVIDSSGQAEMDRGVLAGVRAGSPYAPLPDSIPGASATFRLPLVSTVER